MPNGEHHGLCQISIYRHQLHGYKKRRAATSGCTLNCSNNSDSNCHLMYYTSSALLSVDEQEKSRGLPFDFTLASLDLSLSIFRFVLLSSRMTSFADCSCLAWNDFNATTGDSVIITCVPDQGYRPHWPLPARGRLLITDNPAMSW